MQNSSFCISMLLAWWRGLGLQNILLQSIPTDTQCLWKLSPVWGLHNKLTSSVFPRRTWVTWLSWVFLHLFWSHPTIPPNQQCQDHEGNSKHRVQPRKIVHFLDVLPDSWEKNVAPFTPALRHGKPAKERVQALTDISHSALYAFAKYKAISLHACMLSQQRNPCTDCKSAQYCTTRWHPHTIPPSYIQVRAVMWECGEGQTDRHTDGRGHYIFRLGVVSRKM